MYSFNFLWEKSKVSEHKSVLKQEHLKILKSSVIQAQQAIDTNKFKKSLTDFEKNKKSLI